jgi:hypothetical protein
MTNCRNFASNLSLRKWKLISNQKLTLEGITQPIFNPDKHTIIILNDFKMYFVEESIYNIITEVIKKNNYNCSYNTIYIATATPCTVCGGIGKTKNMQPQDFGSVKDICWKRSWASQFLTIKANENIIILYSPPSKINKKSEYNSLCESCLGIGIEGFDSYFDVLNPLKMVLKAKE